MKGILKIHKKLPLLIAIPTTAGTGSETTLAAVITDAETRHKYAINDFPLIPRYAVLDPKVTLSLPPFITATTGMAPPISQAVPSPNPTLDMSTQLHIPSAENIMFHMGLPMQ